MSWLWLWWIAAGVVLAIELMSGTVYLLLLAFGMGSAGMVAWMGAPLAHQMLACATVSGLSMGLLHLWRRRAVASAVASGKAATPQFDLDIGHRVHVADWHPDGNATVRYRGAAWQARWHGPHPPPGPGEYSIMAVSGSILILGDQEQSPSN